MASWLNTKVWCMPSSHWTPYILKSTLNEVLLHLNLWQDGRLAGKDVEQWGRAQAFHFRNLVAVSRKVASRCTRGWRLPVAVRSLVT